ncbi:MAG: filamentous hemagglutinin N-terminal domain-containing protein, partial [Pseudomonadales bacterium]|nr:filamentous hemagglutinin N-terminal domain-containing protein [Pseudomonadales bacterium]
MSNGCRDIFVRRAPNAGRAVVALWLVAHLAVTTPALALPQDGRITAGDGAIEQTSASSLLIEQRTQRMAADFTSFDIGAGEAVNILQPGRTAVFLGNITGESATTIFGTLTANGQVILVNPRGVVFGENSRVDTASLVATSLGVDVDAFMDGAIELEFAAEVAGRIVNRGVLEAASGGSVTLLGDEVVNEGLIVAELGRVNLASGSRAVLTFDAEGLVGLEVTEAALGGLGGDAAVLNNGTIEANGGQILLAADAARDLFDRAVNNEGILRANGAREVNGEIVLTSTADTFSSGEILAVNDAGVGGRVDVLGDRVAITAGTIDVSGSDGGGRVRIGGDFRGADTLPRADRSYVGPDARIAADATRDGDGGEVVVWGDTEIRYFGRTSARGGAEGGDGGFVELSARDGFEIGGEVDTSAPNGATGTLLLDPTEIFIVEGAGTLDGEVDPGPPVDADVLFGDGDPNTTISVAALQGLGDSNITLEATDQITVGTAGGTAADVDLSATLTTATLTLRAGNGSGGAGDITFNPGSRIETGGGGLALQAGTTGDASGDATLGEIVTAGGTLTIDALGDIDFAGGATRVGGLVLDAGGTILVGGGPIDVTGASPIDFDAPVVLRSDLVITGAGDIAFNATVDGDGAGGAESLTLDAAGTIDFAAGAVVGGTDPLANLVVADSAGATFADAVTLAGALEIRDTAGTVTLGGDLVVDALTTAGSGYALNLLEDVSVTTTANFLNSGALTLGDGADDVLVFSGGLATAGNGTNPVTTRIGGTLRSTAQAITLGPVTLGSNAVVDSTGGALSLQSVTSGGGFDLVLDGGSGSVAVAGAVVGVGDLELRGSGGVLFGDTVEASDVTLAATAGTIEFRNVLTATSLSTGAAPFAVDFDAAPNVSGTGDFDNTGGLTFAAGGFFGGGIDVSSSATSAAGALRSNGGSILLRDLDLAAAAVLDSAGGAIDVQAVTSNGFALTLDGADTGTIDIATLAGDGALTIVDSAGAAFAGSVAASTVTLTDSAGTIAFQGDTTISDRLATASQPYAVSFTGTSTSVAGATTFANSGTITLGDGGDALTFDSGVVATAPTAIDLNGTVAVNSGVITLGDGDTTLNVASTTTIGGSSTGGINLGLANLADGVTLTVGTGIANSITVAGVVGTADAGSTVEGLEIDTTAAVTVTGAIGAADGSNDLDQLEIVQSGGTTFEGTFDAGSVVLTDTTGTIAFEDVTRIGVGLVTSGAAYDVAFSGADTRIAGSTDFLNTGSVRFGGDLTDTTVFVGGVNTRGNASNPSLTILEGTLRTGLGAGQEVQLGSTRLVGPTTIVAGAGAVSATDVTDQNNGFGLTVQDAGATGAVSIGGFQLGALTTRGGAYDVSLLDSGTVTGDTNFLNTGTVVLGDEGDGTDTLRFLGGLATAGNVTNPSATFVNAAIVSADTRVDLGATTLAGATTLRSGDGAIAIASLAGSGQSLSLQTAGDAGTVTIAGAATIGTLLTGASDFDIAFNDGAGASTTTLEAATRFDNTGRVSFGEDAGDVTVVGGALSTAAAVGGTELAGLLSTQAANGDMTLSASTLNADAVVSSGSGAISLAAVAGAGLDLTLQDATPASTGAVTIAGPVILGSLGTFAQAYDVSLLGGGTIAAATDFRNGGSLTLGDGAVDVLDFGAGLVTTNAAGPLEVAGVLRTADADMLLRAATLTAATRLESGSGAIEIASLTDGAGAFTLQLQDAAAVGAVTIDGALTVNRLVTAAGAFDVSLLGGATMELDTNFINLGTVTLGDDVGDASVFLGGLATTAAGGTATAGRIITAGADLDLGATTLTAETTLESGGGSLNLGVVDSGGARLALDGAAGAVRVGSFLGQ